MFNRIDFFPSALLASALFHIGVFGLSAISPTPVQYPVHDALNSIDVVLVEEVPPPKEEIIQKIVEPVEEEIEAPVEEPVKEEKVEIEESRESLGAVSEATPLEFVNLAPEYPALARRRGWEGLVVLQVRVEKDGTPSAVVILESSGHNILDRAAQEAIQRWRFKPAQSGLLTFASTVNIPVRFQLIENK